MTDKLEALKAAALAATPGPWEYRAGDYDYSIRQAGSTIKYSGCEEYTPIAGEVTGAETAAFIAATSPDVVLSLLAALEEANSKNYLADMLEWRGKAEAAGRREEHLKADVTLMAQRNKDLESDVRVADGIIANHQKLNAELEQRLRRHKPIKLPDVLFIKISGQVVAVMAATAVIERIHTAGHKVEGE